MPRKYILGYYYYIHNPLLVNSLWQESGCPHPTSPHHTEVSDESRMPKGRQKENKNKNWFTFQKFPEPTVPETSHEL
jgi:hypothetical protein